MEVGESPSQVRKGSSKVASANILSNQLHCHPSCFDRCLLLLQLSPRQEVADERGKKRNDTRDIRDPIRQHLLSRNLNRSISFIVTTMGVPLRVSDGADAASALAYASPSGRLAS